MSSVFDAPTTEQETSQTTEQTNDGQTTDDWIKQVVTEKGEQWEDPQVIAKGYVHAQKRIKELEALAEEAKKNDYAKDLLEQLQAKQAQAAAPEEPEVEQTPPSSTEQESNTSFKPEDIESLLEKTLTARERSKVVETTLKEKFGDNANVVVHNRAKELGLSIDRMKELALESPQAFLNLVGEPETKQTNTTQRTTVNTSSKFNSNSTERDAAYYSKLRRDNRKLYYHPDTQLQMLEDKRRLGGNW